MSISTVNISPSGALGNKAKKANDIGKATATMITKLKTRDELDEVCRELIQDYKRDILPTDDASAFWLAKAGESMESFNNSLNDYLVKKNERDLEGFNYEYIYIYYVTCNIIVNQILPSLHGSILNEQSYSHLKHELLVNDMYYLEIKGIIEKRNQPLEEDLLMARFQNLKRSFSSAGSSPVQGYTHLHPLQPLQPSPPKQLPQTTLISPPIQDSSLRSPVLVPQQKYVVTQQGLQLNNNSNSNSPSLFQNNVFSTHNLSQTSDLSSVRSMSPNLLPLHHPNSILTSPVLTPQQHHDTFVTSPFLKPTRVILSPPKLLASLHPVTSSSSNGSNMSFSLNAQVISATELADLVQKHPLSILIVDYRSKVDFDYRHIYFANSPNVIHIDPVLVRPDYTLMDIEISSMLTNSSHERKLFSSRHLFDLIVIYDYETQDVTQSSNLQTIFEVLATKSLGKPLRRTPVLLRGGLKHWIETFGALGIASNLGIIKDDLSIEMRNQYLSKPVAIPSRESGNVDVLAKDTLSYDSSQSSLNSLEKLKYNRSLNDFFAQQFQKKSSPLLLPLLPKRPVSFNSDVKQLPKMNVDIEKPQSAVFSPRKTSNPANDTVLSLEAQKSEQKINQFDKNLVIITGISNMGNTCYMNCILQCLVGTKGLTKFFLLKDYENKINFQSRLGSKGMISKAFHGVVNDMYNRSTTDQKQAYYITPQKFKQTLGALNSDFKGFQQQDCSEFLNYLLDSLHEDLNQKGHALKFPPLTTEEEAKREKMSIRLASTIEWEKYLKTDFSSIVDFFQGQYLSRLQCTVCNTTSTSYNPFSTLSIPIPENYKGPITLDKCLEDFCKPEVLDGDDKWNCPHCKKKQVATKFLRISILPKNLIIHLKRFKIGALYVTKLNTFVHYPLKMSMLKYWPPVESEADELKLKEFPNRGQQPPFDYELYGVVNHYGSLRSGHYTSYVDKSSTTKNGWCYFDDTSVTRNCDVSKVVNENAYVLFYRRT